MNFNLECPDNHDIFSLDHIADNLVARESLRKIEQIKMLKFATNVGLAEAKETIEKAIERKEQAELATQLWGKLRDAIYPYTSDHRNAAADIIELLKQEGLL